MTKYIELYGLNLLIEFDYQPYEDGDLETPSVAEEIEDVSYVIHKGEDIIDLLSEDMIESIKVAILEQ